MGTLGGNLCLDTRCNYYDQNYEWRKAIDFCMKKDGETCWVATVEPEVPGGVVDRHGADAVRARRVGDARRSATATARIAVADLYRNDGIHYLTRQPTELLTAVHLPGGGWRSAYWKLRRRGAFDFPVLSVAAAVRLARRRHGRRGAHRARRGRVVADRGDARRPTRSSASALTDAAIARGGRPRGAAGAADGQHRLLAASGESEWRASS